MRCIQTSQRDGFTGTDFETQNFLIFCVVVVSWYFYKTTRMWKHNDERQHVSKYLVWSRHLWTCFLLSTLLCLSTNWFLFLETLLSYYSYCVFRKISNWSILTRTHSTHCFTLKIAFRLRWELLSWLLFCPGYDWAICASLATSKMGGGTGVPLGLPLLIHI